METTLLFALPCLVAFVCVPELIMSALFGRGAFDATAVNAAASTLVAYAVGLLPFVLVRSVVASFTARGDTRTPLIASLIGIAVNVLLKILLMDQYAQVGLALATSVGAWVNVLLLIWLARRQHLIVVDSRLRWMTLLQVLAALLVCAWLLLATQPLQLWLRGLDVRLVAELSLLLLAAGSAVLYFGGVRFFRVRFLRLTA